MTERDGKLKPKAILDDVGDVKYYLRVDDKISEEEDAEDVMVLDSSAPVVIRPDGKLKQFYESFAQNNAEGQNEMAPKEESNEVLKINGLEASMNLE